MKKHRFCCCPSWHYAKRDWELVLVFPLQKAYQEWHYPNFGAYHQTKSGPNNKQLVALTERAHCKYITPNKMITQSFLLPTFRRFNSQQRHSKSGCSCQLREEEVDSNLLLLDKQYTIATQKLCQIKRCHQLSGQKIF